MSLKNRLFVKDSRRSSCDLTANLQHALKKLCKDKPIRLNTLKIEYDRFFKDKISTKPPEMVSAALKSLDNDVIAVKVYMHIDNREMTDVLLGLRSASYAADMHHEDNPQLSKERLLHIIRDSDSLGIHVRDLEKRYLSLYGTRPSYLPFKSIKELLHRTPDVELASSGKNLRVRTRHTQVLAKKIQVTKIPSLNRSIMTSSLKVRKTQDFMSASVKLSDSRLRQDHEMSMSVFVPSQPPSDASPPPSSSGSCSPTGSVDMSVSMVLPPSFHRGFATDRSQRNTSAKRIADYARYSKEVMATILNDFPAEGMSLKALTEEFLNILGPEYPLGMTTVEFLNREFSDVVKLDEDDNGVRVFKMNSPLLPRRTIADVYTKLALQSNRKPSDRVLKVLKDIYRKSTSGSPVTPSDRNAQHAPPTTPKSASGSIADGKRDPMQEAVINELQQKMFSTSGVQSRVPVFKSPRRNKQNVIEAIRSRLQKGPIEYPTEFDDLTRDLKDDTQTLLVELMSSLNLCLKPQNGRMVLQAS